MNNRMMTMLPLAVLAATMTQPAAAAAADDVAAARAAYQSLQAAGEAAKYAPEALAAAGQAVDAAEKAPAGTLDASHAAFVAAKKVEIAGLLAAAHRDEALRAKLSARLDGIRQGNETITTIAGDAVGVTPPPLAMQPLADAGAPQSPAAGAQPAGSGQPAAAGPAALVTLAGAEFGAGGSLLPPGQRALKRVVPELFAQRPPQPVVIATAGDDAPARRRAAAVKAFLVSGGVPEWRVQTRALRDETLVPRDGVAVFARGPG
jgi:hypothetical protein